MSHNLAKRQFYGLSYTAQQEESLPMAWTCAHSGDVHLDEDRYFGDTAQCLEWFVADAIGHSVDLFAINGDLTTYKATIKERNLWSTC